MLSAPLVDLTGFSTGNMRHGLGVAGEFAVLDLCFGHDFEKVPPSFAIAFELALRPFGYINDVVLLRALPPALLHSRPILIDEEAFSSCIRRGAGCADCRGGCSAGRC